MKNLCLSSPIAISDQRFQLGECPLWSVEEQALYFVDISAKQIHRYSPSDDQLQTWSAPEEPGCIALLAGRRLMVALRSGFATFDPAQNSWGQIIAVAHDTKAFRYNDGRCDALGRFWAGTMYEPRTEAAGALYYLERGQVHRVLGPENQAGVKVSNGLAFGKDCLYQSDTPNHLIRRYEYDLASARVGAASVFATMNADKTAPDYGGRPDGAAIDSEGYYWSAQYEGARLLRFSPGGEIDSVITLPVKRPTMLAFGGEDMQTLFVTSAGENATAAELAAYPDTGKLLMLRVAVAGKAEPTYQE